MEDKQALELIRKYLRNTCSADELREVRKLIRQGIDDTLWNQALQEEQVLIDKPITLQKDYSKALYDKINKRITHQPAARGAQRYMSWAKWSAGIAASLIAAYFLIQYVNGFRNEEPTLAALTTQYHERKQLVLNDSSQVWINSASTLRYPQSFATKQRKVVLEGEAFFEVKKDATRPFVVETGPLAVKVLGTSFNIRSFESDSEMIITLATGKVDIIRNEERIASLVPGEQLIYNKRDSTFRKTSANIASSHAWRDGVLTFSSTPLSEVIPVLERWYGVHITIADDSLAETRITLRQSDDSLNNMLDILAFTAGLEYTINGNSVTLFKQNH